MPNCCKNEPWITPAERRALKRFLRALGAAAVAAILDQSIVWLQSGAPDMTIRAFLIPVATATLLAMDKFIRDKGDPPVK